MPEGLKKIISLLLLSGAIFGSFVLGYWTGENQVVCDICPPQDINFSLFWEAYHILQEKYVDKGELNDEDILHGAISGMVDSLNDPYTVFFKPQETKRFIEDVKGVFEGVGMEIGIRDGELQVVAPLEGTPAKEAGLRPGDRILRVDGEPTTDMTLDEAVDAIRGPEGTTVTLTVYRESWKESRDVEIVRGVIEIPSLNWELMESTTGEQNIAYLKLYHFSGRAGFDFVQAALEILDSPAEKIILDLRNNPGGYLEIAQSIAGWFLEKGEVVVIEEFGSGERIEYKSEGNGSFLDYDVVVLINEGSASGSEILAGALRDQRGTLLIGERSFGKGSVQQLEKLRDGSSLKITVARWLTPDDHLITDTGLEPDIKVEIESEDYEEGEDPQLDKAIEVISNL
ncbi:MAG: PDZ domain-containing protein [Candidatus Nealsonbacteria bacterium]|nr:PDZ domain-containing protein [Candidatus Nealsonbacteria bacterium]